MLYPYDGDDGRIGRVNSNVRESRKLFEFMKIWNIDDYWVIGILKVLSICGVTLEVCASKVQKSSRSSCIRD